MAIFCPEKYQTNYPDLCEEFLGLEGELEDKEAKLTLIRFLRANLDYACFLLTGINLLPYQIIILKGWFNRNFNMMIAARGVGKSWLAAVFCYIYLIFNPGAKILIAGPTFRTARHIFNEIEKMVNRRESILLRQAIVKDPSRRTDICEWTINGGTVTAIPLNGEKIRGHRCHVLITDETLLLTEDMIDKVLLPFLSVNENMEERLEIKKREDELVSLGVLKDEERTKFKNTSKMICLSSASFTFQHLYKKFCQWQEMILSNQDEETTYFISQLSYLAAPEEQISSTVVAEALAAGGATNPIFLREWMGQFTDGSDGYFSAIKMQACSMQPGESPHLTLRGNDNTIYLLSIDPNANESKGSDDFAMCVMEYNPKTGYGTVVHQYANHEADLKANVDYFYYLVTHFNIIFIILDHAGGKKFVESANLSESFKKDKMKFSFFEFDNDLEGPEYEESLAKARCEYNLQNRRICLERHFSSDWIRRGNEELQERINYKRVFFGSAIRPDDIVFESVVKQDVDTSFLGFMGETRNEIVLEAIDEQDHLIQLVKDECALIEVKTTLQGVQSFDLPQHLRRDRSPTRARKDSYTALMLANWACKCYYDLMSYKPRVIQYTFVPTCIGELN